MLRLVEPMWVEHQGRRFLYLRDPLPMSELTVMIPEAAAPVVTLLDGTRNLPEIRSALALRFGLTVSNEDVRSLVGQLDQAMLIQNGEYRRAYGRAVRAYRRADHRPSSHAGAVYPDSAAGLESAIVRWCKQTPPAEPVSRSSGGLVGMLCPHIDYNRGHATYADLWQRAEPDLSEVETVVVLGTDHHGGLGQITPTGQSYATPYGTLRTDEDIVNEIAAAVGKDAFAEELHHTIEHSIELAVVWLHHFTRGRSLSVVPILCGSFHEFTTGESNPEDAEQLTGMIEVLQQVMADRRTLIIAAGDLAHVGPAFGDSAALDSSAKEQLKSEDEQSIAAICGADAGRFLSISRSESDRRRICGLPPIYLMLRLLAGAQGSHMGYDQCPADEVNGSVVSIAGALLYR